jgi:hypothetical protein
MVVAPRRRPRYHCVVPTPRELDVVPASEFPDAEPNPLAKQERVRAYGFVTGVSAWLYGFSVRTGAMVSETIDLIISDPHYADAYHRYLDAVRSAPITKKISAHDRLARLRLHKDAQPLETEATRLLQAVFDTADRIRSRTPKVSTTTPEAAQRENLLWFMADPMVPSEIAEGWMGVLRAGVELQLLDLRAWSIANGSPREGFDVSDEHAMQLMALLKDDLYAYLRLLASVSGSGVPESLVPKCDRHDLGALQERQREIMKALDDLAATPDNRRQ